MLPLFALLVVVSFIVVRLAGVTQAKQTQEILKKIWFSASRQCWLAITEVVSVLSGVKS